MEPSDQQPQLRQAPRETGIPPPHAPSPIFWNANGLRAGWRLLIGPDGSRGERGPGEAGCTVRGAASDLHLLLWNRRGAEVIEVLGDAELMERWRSSVQVRWR